MKLSDCRPRPVLLAGIINQADQKLARKRMMAAARQRKWYARHKKKGKQ